MASTPKPAIVSWQQHWNGRKEWAQSQGIPYPVYQSVVKFDYNRLTNPNGFGHPMSDTEAFDAMMSLKNGHDPFTTPGTTAPTVLDDPAKALYQNAQNIFTGLFHAPEALWGDVDALVHGHPGRIANLIPGYTDITSLFSSQGRQYLLENPLSDLLDLGGIGKLADLAESGLRSAGMDGAADTLKAIPDHPMSTAIKGTSAKLISEYAWAQNMNEGFVNTLQHFGYEKGQINYIIRPSRALKRLVQNTPFPDYFNQMTMKFGHMPKSESVLHRVNSLARPLSDLEREQVANILSYNHLDKNDTSPDTIITPRQFLKSPDFPKSQKLALRSLEAAANSMEMAKQLTLGKIRQVFNPVTDETGYVADTRNDEGQWAYSSEWDKFLRSVAKAQSDYEKAQTATNDLALSIGNSVDTLQHSHTQLPRALAWDAKGTVVPMSQAINRVADFFRVNARKILGQLPAASYKKVPTSLIFGKGDLLKIFKVDSPRWIWEDHPEGEIRLYRPETNDLDQSLNMESSRSWYPSYEDARYAARGRYSNASIYAVDVPAEKLGSSFVYQETSEGVPFYTTKSSVQLRRTTRTIGTTPEKFESSLDTLHKDIYDLSKKISSYSKSTDYKSVKSSIDKIRRDLRKSAIPESEVKLWLFDQLKVIQDESANLRKQWDNVPNIERALRITSKHLESRKSQLPYVWNRWTQGRYEALVKQKMAELTKEYFTTHYSSGEIYEAATETGISATPEMITKAQSDVERGYFFSPEVLQLMPTSAWVDIQKSSYMFIDEMKSMGYDPVFMSAVPPRTAESIQRGSVRADLSRYTTIAAEHKTGGILTNHIYNAWLAIPKEASDIYFTQGVRTLIDDFFFRRTLSRNEIQTLSEDYFFKKGVATDLHGIDDRIEAYIKQFHLTEWNPNDPLGLDPSLRSTGALGSNVIYIRRSDLKLMESTFREMEKTMNKMYSAAMSGYRLGVLYASPRYFAHIALGGGMLTMLRMEHPLIDTVRHIRSAWSIAKDPNSLPMLMSHGVAEQDVHGNLVSDPFGVYNFHAGSKLGTLLKEEGAIHRGIEKTEAGLAVYKDFLEHIANTQRALSFLAAKSRATAADITPEILEESKLWNLSPEEVIGAHAANKALADMDTMAPFERAVIMRWMMPFYGWTKHILRYVTTFPHDYPLRASIINTLAQQAIGDGADLPDYLFRLLFLGQPNAQGNVTVIDYRQWNPFRDVANYMTVGGIVSSLNPFISAALNSAFGVDPVTGSTTLYPELTYNSFYGSTQAMGGQPYLTSLIQQFSPQINTLTQVARSTSVLRQEARANPSELPYLIADSIGIPWVPYTLNVNDTKIKESDNQYSLAAGAVQKALTENSIAPLNGYSGLLPLNGYEVNKNFIGGLVNAAVAENRQTDTTVPALDLFALPYANEYSPSYLITGSLAPPDRTNQEPGGLAQ